MKCDIRKMTANYKSNLDKMFMNMFIRCTERNMLNLSISNSNYNGKLIFTIIFKKNIKRKY